MSRFCYLEDDSKTKDYVKLTIQAVRNKDNITTIDNYIQVEEIKKHCERQIDWDKNKVMCEWVTNNAKPFRNYLNTIKLLSLVILCDHKDIDDLTKEEFEDIRKSLNTNHYLLDYIF